MSDGLFALKLPPGLYKNGTRYQAAGRWHDANLVRFLDGTIQPVGGWRRLQNDSNTDLAALVGAPRAAIGWRTDSGDAYIGVGTVGDGRLTPTPGTAKLYVIGGGLTHDITPAGAVPSHIEAEPIDDAGGYGSLTPTPGVNVYGAGLYGVGSLQTGMADPDTWQLDTFGDMLVAVATSDRKLFVWAGAPATPAAVPAGAPAEAHAVVVTPERFLTVLGATGQDGNFSVRLVRWASQETTDEWDADVANTAGEFELSTNGRLMCGRRTRSLTLLWTDTDLHTMTYIGGSFVYRFDQAGENCGVIAPNAVAIVDTQAFWMGRKNFFAFDGFAKPLPCDVRDYVFNDFNEAQVAKVVAVPVTAYGEVWWYYPSAGSTENDRYVVYNYRENHWTVGRLARTAGFDATASSYPVLFSPAGIGYEHEVLTDRDNEVPYLESGPVEIGTGDRVMKIQRLVPDEKTLGDVEARIMSAFYPTAAETTHGPFPVANPTSVRIAGRQIRVRLDQVRETNWRVGVLRLALTLAGRR